MKEAGKQLSVGGNRLRSFMRRLEGLLITRRPAAVDWPDDRRLQFVYRELPESAGLAEQPATTVTLTGEQLRKFAGSYGTPMGDPIQVELKGDHLQVHMKTGQVMDLVPRSPTEFALRHTAGTIVFEAKATGEVTGFSLHLGGEKYPIARLAAQP